MKLISHDFLISLITSYAETDPDDIPQVHEVVAKTIEVLTELDLIRVERLKGPGASNG